MPLPLRKRLEVAKALATRPKVLLLDEVMAGLTPTEVDELIKLILRLKDQGLGILLIEHVMRGVMALSDRVMVINYGREDSRRPAPGGGQGGDACRRPTWARSSAMLSVKDIDVYYGDMQALRGVSFEVAKGEMVSIVGSNGSGKSTTLRTISGLSRVKKGSIRFLDQKINKTPFRRYRADGHQPCARRPAALPQHDRLGKPGDGRPVSPQ